MIKDEGREFVAAKSFPKPEPAVNISKLDSVEPKQKDQPRTRAFEFIGLIVGLAMALIGGVAFVQEDYAKATTFMLLYIGLSRDWEHGILDGLGILKHREK